MLSVLVNPSLIFQKLLEEIFCQRLMLFQYANVEIEVLHEVGLELDS